MKVFLLLPLLALPFLFGSQTVVAEQCPTWLNQDFRQLHSENTFNLCEKSNGKALLIINTASHCGFTPQFSGLEALHQRYKDQGLMVVGFASNDFRQAAKTEAQAASICYENYGVSFTMAAPINVKGNNAHPLFKQLANKTQAPSWNFNKYLVSADGETVEHFGSRTSPDDASFNTTINNFL